MSVIWRWLRGCLCGFCLVWEKQARIRAIGSLRSDGIGNSIMVVMGKARCDRERQNTKHLHRNQFWHWCCSSYDLCDRISTDFVNPEEEELTTPSWSQVAAKMTVSAAWSQKSTVWNTCGQSLDLFLPERILTVWISHLPAFLAKMLLQSAQSGENVSTSLTLLTRSPFCSEP